VPISFGAANAGTERATVLFTGDAGFMMSQPEMDTAMRQDIPVIVVAMNDAALGSEYQQLAGRDMYTDAAVVQSPDFADLAESFGAEGHTVRSVEDLETVADRVRDPPDGPLVLDCKIDRDVKHRFYDTVHEF
jgi:thiamine pyrophosphate-dependent acetolactate synthase large subunit-like protein